MTDTLRDVMRQWTSGVCIICSQHRDFSHGMTVNSFTSISIDPPVISITLAEGTRTLHLVQDSGVFSVSILGSTQIEISDRFSGKIVDEGDRLFGLETIKLPGGTIALKDSLGWLECTVREQIQIGTSIHILADVTYSKVGIKKKPLIYHNRSYFFI